MSQVRFHHDTPESVNAFARREAMDKKSYKKRLMEIERHLINHEFDSCISDCGRAFERALRELVGQVYASFQSIEEQQAFLDAQRKSTGKAHASGNSTFKGFGLGELVGLFHHANLWNKLKKIKNSNLADSRKIDWEAVRILRNDCVHETRNTTTSQADLIHAQQMVLWLRTLLYETELIDSSHGLAVLDAKTGTCSVCHENLQDIWHFCPICGARRPRCTECGHLLNPNWNICKYCDTPARGSVADSQAEKLYDLVSKSVWKDGVLNADERSMLDEFRLELGLTPEKAEKIENNNAPPGVTDYIGVLQSVYVDGVITEWERQHLNRKAAELGLDSQLAKNLEIEHRNRLQPQQQQAERAP